MTENHFDHYYKRWPESTRTAIELDAARYPACDPRFTLLVCILSGRRRLRELGDRINDEGPVDDLAVAARMAWDLLPDRERAWWLEPGADTRPGDSRLIRELRHVFDTRLDIETFAMEYVGDDHELDGAHDR
jgi:hypothetical protein